MIASAIGLLPLLVPSTRVVHAQTAVQWIGTAGGNGLWYQRVTRPSEVSWLEADSAASAAGGHSVTVNSAEEAGSSGRLSQVFSTSRFLHSLRLLRLRIALRATHALKHLLPHAEMVRRLRRRPTRLWEAVGLMQVVYDLPKGCASSVLSNVSGAQVGLAGTRHADGSEFGI